jgi:hypothetical protein
VTSKAHYTPLFVDAESVIDASKNPHHAKFVDGRLTGSGESPKQASAYVTLRRTPGQRFMTVGTGPIEGASRDQAMEVLEQILLDAYNDVRKMRLGKGA